MRRRLTWWAPGPLLAASLLGTATAQATDLVVGGRVVDDGGVPLAGAAVVLELSGEETSERTDADGRFAIDVGARFAADALDTEFANIRAERDGFRCELLLLEFQARGAVRAGEVVIPCQAVSGTTALDPADRELLDPLVSSHGRTLFVAPYLVTDDVGAPVASPVNTVLRDHVSLRIHSHLQSLRETSGIAGEDYEVSVVELPPGFQVQARERIRAVGQHLRAVAVVGGRGTLAGERISFRSDFVMIPALPRVELPSAMVMDSMAVRDFFAADVIDGLSRKWGDYTLLALSVQEFRRAVDDGDAAGLERVRDYLIAERGTLGADARSRRLAETITQLVELIDEALP